MEKFALLNILKALEGLSAKNEGESVPKEEIRQKTEPVTESIEFNAMANILERHERISNRVRNKN